jgi:hypothetical protein
MVTRYQLEKLSLRIEKVAKAMGGDEIEYRVLLHFDGETPEQFYARYPDEHPSHPSYRKPKQSIRLRFN